MSIRRLIVLGACLGMAAPAACFSGESTVDDGVNGPLAPRTCKVTGPPIPVAPGGYYTQGASVCTTDGTPHFFHGVDRPSLEWDPNGEGPTGEGIPASDFQAMASWHANVVRIATNQDFWLSGAALYDSSYQANVDQAVHDAEAAGLDVILDLHWSDEGNLDVTTSGKEQDSPTDSDQQPMADVNSKQFWAEVATKYKDDGHVLFELYNEPNGISWDTWLNGGTYAGYQVVGMQELYNTVRGVGANNVVIAGGLSYAFDLSEVQIYAIQGYNIMYATHDYPTNDSESQWQSSFGYLTSGNIAPVIATEFGDTTASCSGSWDTDLINFANANEMSWTAWAWFPGGCTFPPLLNDWAPYEPSAAGIVVKAALANYPAPVPPAVDAGPDSTAADGGVDATPDQDAEPVIQDAQPEGAATLDASGGADSSGASEGGATESGVPSDGGVPSDATPDGS